MKHEIEARLDRSLENQIAAPQLGKQFDAAVWSRIAADEAPATNPVAKTRGANFSRWLFISNVVGASVAVIVAIHFALRMYGGIDLGINVSVPPIPADVTPHLVAAGEYLVSIAALGVGLALTPFGRRLRSQFF